MPKEKLDYGVVLAASEKMELLSDLSVELSRVADLDLLMEHILTAARRASIEIPAMCADPRLKPTGTCDMCLVMVEGRDEPIKACMEAAAPGMRITISTSTPRARAISATSKSSG